MQRKHQKNELSFLLQTWFDTSEKLKNLNVNIEKRGYFVILQNLLKTLSLFRFDDWTLGDLFQPSNILGQFIHRIQNEQYYTKPTKRYY